MIDPATKPFGDYIRRLREVRGLTQEVLAERCGLASDTIRRLEHGEFSPSLRTLRKTAAGLDLSVSQLFQGFDLDDDRDEARELTALVRGRGPQTIARIVDLTRAFLRALDEQRDSDAH